jgi:hypothetical protein
MGEKKDTFKKSMQQIDKSIEKIISLNNYLKAIDKKKK